MATKTQTPTAALKFARLPSCSHVKPGSTDPSDSFSGWLDNLNISAG